jgi:CubicO group peptidase (beta-lactamase class C family)
MKALKLAAVAILLTACAFAANGETPALDRAMFTGALTEARSMPRLHSLLVSHNGELVLEEYFNGVSRSRAANVKSVSKSIMSALIGIAIERGHIEGLDQPISDYYGDRIGDDPTGFKQRITVPTCYRCRPDSRPRVPTTSVPGF